MFRIYLIRKLPESRKIWKISKNLYKVHWIISVHAKANDDEIKTTSPLGQIKQRFACWDTWAKNIFPSDIVNIETTSWKKYSFQKFRYTRTSIFFIKRWTCSIWNNHCKNRNFQKIHHKNCDNFVCMPKKVKRKLLTVHLFLTRFSS